MRCGAVAQDGFAPTAASSYPNPPPGSTPYPNPAVSATPPFTPPFNAGLQQPGSGYTQTAPQIPSTRYGTPPPPPPTDPYAPSSLSNPYNTPGLAPTYPPFQQQPKKKLSPVALIIIGIVAVLVLACSGSIYALSKALSNFHLPGTSTITDVGSISSSSSSSGGTSSSQDLNNLKIVYSSDEMTFTSLQEAPNFKDDTYTTGYAAKPNYVRVNFKEHQLEGHFSLFSYRSVFHLLLPDKSVIAPQQAQSYLGPELDVVRTNWVDFATNASVDLNQLTLRVGADDEVQMDIPLKSGGDVSKYQPKTATLNKLFHYAGLNWTLTSATQTLSTGGKQAKSGKVYIAVTLATNNPTSNEFYLGDLFRLKAGETVASPDYSSNMDGIQLIKPNTTNLQGTVIFLVPPASTYTLDLLPKSGYLYNITEQTVDFQIA
jgi:hypothetical protein